MLLAKLCRYIFRRLLVPFGAFSTVVVGTRTIEQRDIAIGYLK